MTRAGLLLLLAGTLLACRTYENGPLFCEKEGPCANMTGHCDMPSKTCVLNDAGDAGPTTDAEDDVPASPVEAPDGSAVETPSGCSSDNDCHSPKPACNISTGACVGCTASYCGKPANSATPLCDTAMDKCVQCTATSKNLCVDNNPVCELTTGFCRGCTSSGECGTATPVCNTATGTKHGACVQCTGNSDCTRSGVAGPACNLTNNTCVPCVASSDCPADNPICDVAKNSCHPCSEDKDCSNAFTGGPGLCVAGRCPKETEVVYVEFNGNGCPGANGSSQNPYCTPNVGAAALASGRRVLVLRGAASDRLTLATSGVSPVIVGRKNAVGDAPSIPATSTTAVTISGDNVLIRDLTLNLGSTAASKGVLVTGTGTKLQLLRVTAQLGTGLGVDAESGADLHMDECLVQNNSAGGVLINDASYQIQNSIFAGNLYGAKFNVPRAPSSFTFNTIVGNTGNAVTCDPSHMQQLVGSIIIGANDSCDIENSWTTPQAFDAARPFHLTNRIGCPMGDPSVPAEHDFDGTSRTKPFDCGADQYSP